MAELAILREEERMLMRIASKLNDQLNRLKVEELTLLSRIRNSQSAFKTPAPSALNQPVVTAAEAEEVVNVKPLDLEVKAFVLQPKKEEMEVEEEEDEESDDEDRKHDQLTAFIQNMAAQHKSPQISL